TCEPCDPLAAIGGCEPDCDLDPTAEGCESELLPCEGNPIEDPRIAAQTNSGIAGGRFGMARNGGTRMHWGLDIQNAPGASVYAMFGGTVHATGNQPRGWGNWVMIRSTVNGKTVDVVYAHTAPAVTGGTVSAGTVIGVSNDSGNLAEAIRDGDAVPHLHIEVAEVSGSLEWNDRKGTPLHLNPEGVLTTKFESNGDPVPGTSC
ncbi:MAG: M23 family metallopeptidase, partial [Longimicrobiales bacterium]|nr:M23 family metallopeptidase [Longimicrobiales bacterium]